MNGKNIEVKSKKSKTEVAALLLEELTAAGNKNADHEDDDDIKIIKNLKHLNNQRSHKHADHEDEGDDDKLRP